MKVSMKVAMLAVMALLFIPFVCSEAGTGCIDCHTDKEKIKSLFKPPKIDFKVEEGEG